MAKKFRAKDFKGNNLDNHLITINSILGFDFKTCSSEHFKICLNKVSEINKLLISRSKCDSDEHYSQILFQADLCLKMAMIERRLGITKHKDMEKKY